MCQSAVFRQEHTNFITFAKQLYSSTYLYLRAVHQLVSLPNTGLAARTNCSLNEISSRNRLLINWNGYWTGPPDSLDVMANRQIIPDPTETWNSV